MTENGCLEIFLCILQVVKELIKTKNGSGRYMNCHCACFIKIWFQMNVVKLNDKVEHNV